MNEDLTQTMINSPTHKMRSLIISLGWLAVLVGTAMIVVITYWLIYPYVPITFTDPVFPVLTKRVKQGKNLEIVSSFCKYMETTPTLTRTFENGLVFSTPQMAVSRDMGCHTVTIHVPIPEELPAGKYHLKQIYQYKVNPLRTITLIHKSEPFEVIE